MKNVSRLLFVLVLVSIAFVVSPRVNKRLVIIASTPIVIPTGKAQTRIEKRLFKYKSLITQAAEEFDVPPSLIAAVIRAESSSNPYAVSNAGAMGLMQLMPDTWRYLGGGGSPFNPGHNIRIGTKYLRELLDTFRGNVRLSVAAYNAGPGAVKRFKRIPPYRETRRYVPRVMKYYRKYKKSKKFA